MSVGLTANARPDKVVRRSGRLVDGWHRDRRYVAKKLVVCADLRMAIEIEGCATSVSAEMPSQVTVLIES
jgi:hypothetical protein